MRGVVFQTLLSAVEATHGLAMVDALVTAVPSKSGGAYTTVGTYDDGELIALVAELARRLDAPLPEVLRSLARPMFEYLRGVYRGPPIDAPDTYGLLELLDPTIHVAVRKLDPKADPPSFQCSRVADRMVVRYRSSRALSALAVALIEGCADHFGERFEITARPLDDTGTDVEIVLQPLARRAGDDE